MQIILSILLAVLLVIGQTLWKLSVDQNKNLFTLPFTLAKFVQILFSPYIIIGAISYILATVTYFYLLSRFQFTTIQFLAIPLVLMITILVGVLIFHDRLTTLNALGVLFILIGVMFITR